MSEWMVYSGTPIPMQNGTLEFYAEDAVGNQSPLKTYTFEVVESYAVPSIAVFVEATITPATATGVAAPVVATATRYTTAQVNPVSAFGLVIAIQAVSAGQTVTSLATARAIGSCTPITANAVRYVAAEVASANAFGRASPIVAEFSSPSTLIQIAQLKGLGGVVYPMYIKAGSTGFRLN